MADTLKRALALAAQSHERSIENLRTLVRLPSLTGEEGPAQTHMANVLRGLGAQTDPYRTTIPWRRDAFRSP